VSAKKILLVDDSTTMLLMEQMVLGSSGYQILTAQDGAAGLQAALSHRPDLIILDVVMPVMNGLEACRQLRAHETTRDTPILLVTTRSESSYVQEGFVSGCSDYVLKPINTHELLSKVKNLLGD
jgi:DNA-binding response OmpR family regulator